jgi:RecB family endonuclease NucS
LVLSTCSAVTIRAATSRSRSNAGGEIDGVEQRCRYLQRLGRSLGAVGGVFAALVFRPWARVLAADWEIACVQLDYDALREMEPLNPTLFRAAAWASDPFSDMSIL